MKLRNTLKYLTLFLAAEMFFSFRVVALGFSLDDGTDANGRVIVSSTLAMRCGISSKNPSITQDCYERLAYDYKTDKPIKFDNFAMERVKIIEDYVSSYIEQAINQMIASGNYEDRISEMLGETPETSQSLNNDIRETIEFNNKLTTANASLFLDTIDLRSSELNIDSITQILDVLVPRTKIDVNDTSLATPGSGG